jgi:hypothetical protein
MKLALLATLLTFGGSVAGFGLTSGIAGGPEAPVAGSPPASSTEHVVVRGKDRDCPKAVAEKA